MTNAILRYNLTERVMHWIAALSYAYVLATGLAFYSPHLYWIATILGGPATSRFWHPWLGCVFAGSLIWMLRAWHADMRITGADRRWGDNVQHYIRNEDESLPPVDRFNLGQKQFFWIMFWATILLLLSGIILWFPESIPWSLRFLRYTGILTHVAAALITIGLFIIHVYMGTAVVRGGFTSIIRGEVSPAWARTHHRLWYDRIVNR